MFGFGKSHFRSPRKRIPQWSPERKSFKDSTRVRVYVRVRPEYEEDDDDSAIRGPLEFPSKREVRVLEQKQETTYRFDRVFSPEASNAEVCKAVSEPLINTVIDGYNGSFMVYGQTGTGKTYTVLSDDGLIPQTVRQLFQRTDGDKEFSYKVFLSYLQIYKDKIYDLLDPSKDVELHLREHPQEGVIVDGLKEFEIPTPTDAERFLEYGRKNLIMAETTMVRLSSRSHSLCIIRVEKFKSSTVVSPAAQKGDDNILEIARTALEREEKVWRGKLYLCDLAGSERLKKTGAAGNRFQEARYINSSLLELGNVIHALADSRHAHVPFRNSTLTRLLKESLGGNSKASLMICVSASLRDINETKCSLNFGQRAMRVTKFSTPNIECSSVASSVCDSSEFPTIDYKALAEYLTKKLKELESAYYLEKENYKQLKKELSQSKRQRSRIPVLKHKLSSNENSPQEELKPLIQLAKSQLELVREEEKAYLSHLRHIEQSTTTDDFLCRNTAEASTETTCVLPGFANESVQVSTSDLFLRTEHIPEGSGDYPYHEELTFTEGLRSVNDCYDGAELRDKDPASLLYNNNSPTFANDLSESQLTLLRSSHTANYDNREQTSLDFIDGPVETSEQIAILSSDKVPKMGNSAGKDEYGNLAESTEVPEEAILRRKVEELTDVTSKRKSANRLSTFLEIVKLRDDGNGGAKFREIDLRWQTEDDARSFSSNVSTPRNSLYRNSYVEIQSPDGSLGNLNNVKEEESLEKSPSQDSPKVVYRPKKAKVLSRLFRRHSFDESKLRQKKKEKRNSVNREDVNVNVPDLRKKTRSVMFDDHVKNKEIVLAALKDLDQDDTPEISKAFSSNDINKPELHNGLLNINGTNGKLIEDSGKLIKGELINLQSEPIKPDRNSVELRRNALDTKIVCQDQIVEDKSLSSNEEKEQTMEIQRDRYSYVDSAVEGNQPNVLMDSDNSIQQQMSAQPLNSIVLDSEKGPVEVVVNNSSTVRGSRLYVRNRGRESFVFETDLSNLDFNASQEPVISEPDSKENSLEYELSSSVSVDEGFVTTDKKTSFKEECSEVDKISNSKITNSLSTNSPVDAKESGFTKPITIGKPAEIVTEQPPESKVRLEATMNDYRDGTSLANLESTHGFSPENTQSNISSDDRILHNDQVKGTKGVSVKSDNVEISPAFASSVKINEIRNGTFEYSECTKNAAEYSSEPKTGICVLFDINGTDSHLEDKGSEIWVPKEATEVTYVSDAVEENKCKSNNIVNSETLDLEKTLICKDIVTIDSKKPSFSVCNGTIDHTDGMAVETEETLNAVTRYENEPSSTKPNTTQIQPRNKSSLIKKTKDDSVWDSFDLEMDQVDKVNVRDSMLLKDEFKPELEDKVNHSDQTVVKRKSVQEEELEKADKANKRRSLVMKAILIDEVMENAQTYNADHLEIITQQISSIGDQSEKEQEEKFKEKISDRDSNELSNRYTNFDSLAIDTDSIKSDASDTVRLNLPYNEMLPEQDTFFDEIDDSYRDTDSPFDFSEVSDENRNYILRPGSVHSSLSTDTELELAHAMEESEKLRASLSNVKKQYDDILHQFDSLLGTKSTTERELENTKEYLAETMKCKLELEEELNRARIQLALVTAARREDSAMESPKSSDSEDVPLTLVKQGSEEEMQSESEESNVNSEFVSQTTLTNVTPIDGTSPIDYPSLSPDAGATENFSDAENEEGSSKLDENAFAFNGGVSPTYLRDADELEETKEEVKVKHLSLEEAQIEETPSFVSTNVSSSTVDKPTIEPLQPSVSSATAEPSLEFEVESALALTEADIKETTEVYTSGVAWTDSPDVVRQANVIFYKTPGVPSKALKSTLNEQVPTKAEKVENVNESVNTTISGIEQPFYRLAFNEDAKPVEKVSKATQENMDLELTGSNVTLKDDSVETIEHKGTVRKKSGRRSRPASKIIEDADPKEFRWISKKGFVTSEEKIKRNEQLTLAAIQNAELKKELLLTKLEKIRLEAVLSCVMMKTPASEVSREYQKLSINSITSSKSTLRSSTSATDLTFSGSDKTSPFHATSRRLSNTQWPKTRLTSESSAASPLNTYDQGLRLSHRETDMVSPTSSLFEHSSLLTDSSFSPLTAGESSPSMSSVVATSMPLSERTAPCGQDQDDQSFSKPKKTRAKDHDGSKSIVSSDATDITSEDSRQDLDEEDKKEKSTVGCLPFLKRRSTKRKSRKSKAGKSPAHSTDSYQL